MSPKAKPFFWLSVRVGLTSPARALGKVDAVNVRARVEAIFEHARSKSSALDRVLIGGAFGCSLRPESLLRIGLLPPIAPRKIFLLGNSAGQGAKIALCDRKAFERLRWIVERTEYIELSYLEPFPRRFVDHMRFPTDRQLEQLESRMEARSRID